MQHMAYLVGEFLILLTLHRCHLTNPESSQNYAGARFGHIACRPPGPRHFVYHGVTIESIIRFAICLCAAVSSRRCTLTLWQGCGQWASTGTEVVVWQHSDESGANLVGESARKVPDEGGIHVSKDICYMCIIFISPVVIIIMTMN